MFQGRNGITTPDSFLNIYALMKFTISLFFLLHFLLFGQVLFQLPRISGITTPMKYISPGLSVANWHVEDLLLKSMIKVNMLTLYSASFSFWCAHVFLSVFMCVICLQMVYGTKIVFTVPASNFQKFQKLLIVNHFIVSTFSSTFHSDLTLGISFLLCYVPVSLNCLNPIYFLVVRE